jgi:hypothetical protein
VVRFNPHFSAYLTKTLLNEIQRQSEILQTQQEELQQTHEESESQTRALRASEQQWQAE